MGIPVVVVSQTRTISCKAFLFGVDPICDRSMRSRSPSGPQEGFMQESHTDPPLELHRLLERQKLNVLNLRVQER